MFDVRHVPGVVVLAASVLTVATSQADEETPTSPIETGSPAATSQADEGTPISPIETGSPAATSQADEGAPIGPIETGSLVAFTYTLSLANGDVVESNSDQEPLTYTQGNGQILEALEAELVGLQAGDEKSVTLAPEDAYGPVREEAMQEVPLDRIPEDAREAGALLSAPGIQGTIRVVEVREENVLLDFNHPLAGETLTFDITIISVQ